MQDVPGRRAPRQDTANIRAALAAVAQTNRRIYQWQIDNARLAAASQRSERPEAIMKFRERALMILSEIDTERELLNQRCRTLPLAAFATGRVADSFRALTNVTTALKETLRTLEVSISQVGNEMRWIGPTDEPNADSGVDSA